MTSVLCVNSVKKEKCTRVESQIAPEHLRTETAKTKNGLLNIARMEEHLECSSFWKLESYLLHHVGDELQGQAKAFFVLGIRLDMREPLHHYLAVEESELILTPLKLMIHSFCCVWISPKSVNRA